MSDNAGTPPNASNPLTSAVPPNSNVAKPKLALTKSEREGIYYFNTLSAYLGKHDGKFLLDESLAPHVLLKTDLVPITTNPENYEMARLMIRACGVTTLSPGAKSAIQRLQVRALDSAGSLKLRKFSALSDANDRIYFPQRNHSQVLVASASGLKLEVNGQNRDSFWLEHPYHDPMEYLPLTPADIRGGLDLFRQLCVEPQSCTIPEMKWFVAVNEGIFPYLREMCSARFLTVHRGASQHGKTTGAQRFLTLHGLGEVKGDFSVAALANQGDIGLLVMDNREQRNFTPALIDYCLFLATGAQYARSDQHGKLRASNRRPLGVITSIEGGYSDELQRRCVDVDYELKPRAERQETPANGILAAGEDGARDVIEGHIRRNRSLIQNSITQVIAHYLTNCSTSARSSSSSSGPEGFEGHFSVIANLFRIMGGMLGKPASWTESIISVWASSISTKPRGENDLEYPLSRIIDKYSGGGAPLGGPSEIIHSGTRGTLLVTTISHLLTDLHELNLKNLVLPQNSQGFGARLKSSKFLSFAILDEDNAPEIKSLKRNMRYRPVGLFIPSE